MPIYEYRCPVCRDIAEHIHAHDDNPTVACPNCGQIMGRLFPSKVVVVFGNGFPHREMGWGWKKNTRVFYPDGHSAEKTHNELYENGVLGATR